MTEPLQRTPSTPPRPERTDWDRYYQRPFAAAHLTRRITARHLTAALRRHAPSAAAPTIAELGGANSCFFDAVEATLHPRRYHVVDSNRLGLDRMRERLGARDDVVYHCADVLDLRLPLAADVVFSVGLVEHFDPEGTRRAVRAHLDLLRPGGICLVAFPTPTWLYRVTRLAAEVLGVWQFPDERPLRAPEVVSELAPDAVLLERSILWPIVLTQAFLVARKLPAPPYDGAGR